MAEAMQWVEMSDGAKLRVKIHGDIPGRMLLIAQHGGPGASDHTESETSFQFLSDRFRVLVFDARGSGDSDLVPPYTHERWVADIEELRIWAQADKFIIGGGSYGGILSLEYAREHPDHLLALIIRDACAFGPFLVENSLRQMLSSAKISPDRERQERLWRGKAHDDADMAHGLMEILPAFAHRSPPPPQSEKEMAEATAALVCHSVTHNAAFARALLDYDVRPHLKSIQVPALVVVGRHDIITPVSCSEEIAAGIPGAQLTVFEESGHSPPAEQPLDFQRRVLAFLSALNL